jgi:hypothetical protein
MKNYSCILLNSKIIKDIYKQFKNANLEIKKIIFDFLFFEIIEKWKSCQ